MDVEGKGKCKKCGGRGAFSPLLDEERHVGFKGIERYDMPAE
jgi:hypothetical protein